MSPSRLPAIAAALLLAGCLGPCNIVDGCPTWTEDRARDNPLITTKVVPLERSELPSKLRPGDLLRFETSDGKRYKVRIKKIERESLVVWGIDDRRYRVPYDVIAKLGVERRKDAGDFVEDVIYRIVTSPSTLLPAGP